MHPELPHGLSSMGGEDTTYSMSTKGVLWTHHAAAFGDAHRIIDERNVYIKMYAFRSREDCLFSVAAFLNFFLLHGVIFGLALFIICIY